ncbi:MAG TPA: VOC family protein [Chloroflexota bacterium]|nr:VOC family protein [Chloroflexota bacterium]
MATQPIVHIDIPATDPKAAGVFYADVFGWQVQTPPGMDDYPMFTADGGPGGGFPRAGQTVDQLTNTVGEPLVYLASQDINSDLQRVQAHGGQTVLPKTAIAEYGWYAIFRDPSGNKIGLYTDRAS